MLDTSEPTFTERRWRWRRKWPRRKLLRKSPSRSGRILSVSTVQLGVRLPGRPQWRWWTVRGQVSLTQKPGSILHRLEGVWELQRKWGSCLTKGARYLHLIDWSEDVASEGGAKYNVIGLRGGVYHDSFNCYCSCLHLLNVFSGIF